MIIGDYFSTMKISKPSPSDLSEYYQSYLHYLPEDDLLQVLKEQKKVFEDFFSSIPPGKESFRYAEGKWTIKEIIIHLIDMERIYGYRMLRFARNDQTILPGFDADKYILLSNANARDISDLLNELEAVRYSTIALLNGFTDEALLQTGIMNGHHVSVRALVYHIAGHELHHMDIIKKKYL